MVARWKPVHHGHAVVLRALCDRAERAVIGIGSANRLDTRNPFSFGESRQMIRLVLKGRDNYTVVGVDDLDDGPRWASMVADLLGSLDLFVTGNPYVASLLCDRYAVARPVELVSPEEHIRLDATMVRRAMAQGDAWRDMVPGEVAAYVIAEGLDERFRREFGLQTLALDAPRPLGGE